jgi:cold shock CspA family protein
MRTQGSLIKWNADRGFGFAKTGDSGIEVFVHISAFPRSGRQPQIGDPISFEIVSADDGRKQAKAVIYEVPLGRADFTLAPTEKKSAQAERTSNAIPARTSAPQYDRHRRHDTREASGGILRNLIAIALLLILGVLGYRKFQDFRATDAAAASAPPATAIAKPSAPAAQSYRCDGRTHCSQMRSCADATQVLKHCPGTEMDGDRDGIPCETQWCN